jgi:POT family proton-dependent oligopeptide transporter
VSDALFIRRAVLRLSTIEFWERYAFYTLFSLLPLFVATPVAAGGMGWSDGDALRFFGVYLLTVQLAPLFGGWLGDRISGRVSLKLGGLLLLVGHAMIAVPNLVAWLFGGTSAGSLTDSLTRLGAPLGGLTPPAGLPPGYHAAYLVISLCFYGSVLLVALGNGLFKPVLTVVVGRLPHPDDGERNAAFTTFFLFLNAGGLVSTLFGGWLAQRFGWGWSFAASASGMGVSIATMFLLERTYIAPFIDKAEQARIAAADPRTVRAALVPVGLLLFAFMIVCVFSYQSYGFVSLFTSKLVDRELLGFTIPPSWFTALNPITIMLFSPLLARVWRRRAPDSRWTSTVQFAGAFLAMTFGFALLAGAAIEARHGLASPLWIIGALVLIALSELMTSPIVNATVTRLTPARHQAFAIGISGGAAGLGAGLSGRLGAAVMEADKVWALTLIAGATLACVVILSAASGWMARRYQL